MSAEAMKPDEPNTEDANRRLNRDVMDTISTLTRHLASLQRGRKPAGGDEDEHGVSIITLAGNNSGATFKNLPSNLDSDVAPDHENDVDPLEWATLVNSNLQAINNSVMIGSKYKGHDPGVHVDISDQDLDPEDHKREKRGGWKGKRKHGNASSASESDAHSSSGDDDHP